MILLGPATLTASKGSAPELAADLADAISRRSAGELHALVAQMRRAAGHRTLGVDLRATGAFQAVVIERFLAGEDSLPALAHMCSVVERANCDPTFDWLSGLFQVDGSAR